MTKDVFFRTNLLKNKIFKPDFFYKKYLGEDLAKWLIESLRENDFFFSEPHQEFWGWKIQLKIDKERFCLQLLIMEESIGKENLEWLITIEKPQSWISFGQQNTSNFEKLCRKIDEILVNEPQISKISWQT